MAADGPVARDGSANTYRTSIVDAIVAGIERLPGRSWLAYVLITFAFLLVFAAEVVTGDFAFNQDWGRIAYGFFFIYPLAAYQYLSLGARTAFDDFRAATDLDDRVAADVRLQLSTTPARPVIALWLFIALANVAGYLAFPVDFDIAERPITHVALRILSESLWVAPMAIVLLYFVYRQLRLVARLHSSVRRVDLLRPAPMHALSRLTSRSSFALVVFAIYSGLPLPGTTEAAWIGTLVGFAVPILVLAVAAFFVPLRGLNRLLVHEKQRMLDEIGLRIHAASEALHRTVDFEAANDSDIEGSRASQTRVDALNKALTTLFQERDVVRRLSTWPWDGTTARAVASAIALPIALFFITRVLDRLVF